MQLAEKPLVRAAATTDINANDDVGWTASDLDRVEPNAA
jgi:hypothetical protein